MIWRFELGKIEVGEKGEVWVGELEECNAGKKGDVGEEGVAGEGEIGEGDAADCEGGKGDGKDEVEEVPNIFLISSSGILCLYQNLTFIFFLSNLFSKLTYNSGCESERFVLQELQEV